MTQAPECHPCHIAIQQVPGTFGSQLEKLASHALHWFPGAKTGQMSFKTLPKIWMVAASDIGHKNKFCSSPV